MTFHEPPPSLFSDQDLYLFHEGTHADLPGCFGAHLTSVAGVAGAMFAVWAPNAASVAVFGDFNGWDPQAHRLRRRDDGGIWEGFVPGAQRGQRYKYQVVSTYDGYVVDKADPFALTAELAPQTASRIWDLGYSWGDAQWMETRAEANTLDAPISIYEVHLGSWMRGAAGEWLSYAEVAPKLAAHCVELGFTHVELLPITEHPFYGSWGYQTTGYFAPTSRYGTPQELMQLVDTLHQAGIGVLLDWVPSHFPRDAHGLNFFDGTHLYEHADPRQGFQPDWGSMVFNYGRPEVRAFLLSSALFWLERYHMDGLRVDAVASMLYLDYSRKQGEWVANQHGGRENLEAIGFLRQLNRQIAARLPDVLTIAEESTSWPMVSWPVDDGGLGFDLKWDMGWMHDTLAYFAEDIIYRKFHQSQLTFRTVYVASEHFVLPLSHDEVVHLKRSLLGKMPGDWWQQLANLRLLLAFMIGLPGKKLLFMGGEIGQWREWDHDSALEWSLLELPTHAGLKRWVADLNWFYRNEPAMHERDTEADGFAWVDCNDAEQSVLSFTRRGSSTDDSILAAFNFTPTPRYGYRIGVPRAGFWHEALNSDAVDYSGGGIGNAGGLATEPIPSHGFPQSLGLTLPPLGAVFFKHAG